MVNLATGFLVISRTARNIFALSWSRSTSDASRSSALSRTFVALSFYTLSGGGISCALLPQF